MTATVQQHFARSAPEVKATYQRLLAVTRGFGPVSEDPKKTSIHLVRRIAFAGVATRRTALMLTLKSDVDIPNSRIERHEQASANRWHLIVRLASPDDVDRTLTRWLKAAYELAR